MKEYKKWEKEKALVPVMIKIYCHGNHGTKGAEVCAACGELTEYALLRLEKCPFRKKKHFCSTCRIHCYKSEMRGRIKAVMKYAGIRIMFSHPIFCFSHVMEVISSRRSNKQNGK